MLGFQVEVNDRVVHRAGVESMAVLSTRVNYQKKPEDQAGETVMSLGTGGMSTNGEFLNWTGEENLSLGDEIRIRIVDLTEWNEPEPSKSISKDISAEITAMLKRIKGLRPPE